MLKNENIICISSIDWDFVWQGHQEIMSTFAKHGNRVLFIENTGVRMPSISDVPRLKKRIVNWFKSVKGFRKEMENLYVYSPLILPFPYSRLARLINKHFLLKSLRRWMSSLEFHDPIIWTFLPTGIALDIINNIENKLVVYYCIADFYELVDNPKKIKKTEDELIKKSDLIFAQGKFLETKCKKNNSNVYIFPFGVNIEAFAAFRHDESHIPSDIKDIKKPIIGYIGGIHRHIDFKLINYFARKHPEWSIVLIGPIQTDVSQLKGLSNISFLGQKDFLSLLSYMAEFDVGIIPYEANDYTQTVFPTKLNEYHAMGIPVVSSNLPEIRDFNSQNDNLVLIASTHQEFADCISQSLTSGSKELRQKREASAARNGWGVRIEEMCCLMERKVEDNSAIIIDWQEKFLKLYNNSRKKVFRVAIFILSAYFLLFHTPLLWILAKPLLVSSPLEKADCVVVFAGGVGESGKAGQGYEERVGQAVDLYKKGYARHMIFSSGYMYVFKEPIVMKALAVSLGVPENAIILEDKASGTYQNVKFTKEILITNGWVKIILVGPPQYMRRVSMVFSKVFPEEKVIYLPLSASRFYPPFKTQNGFNFAKQITLDQIRRIFYEYAAIVYYWWKGYV